MEFIDKTRISFAVNQLFSKIWKEPLAIADTTTPKHLICTLNTHSFITALDDQGFYQALLKSDILIPDGVGVVFGLKLLYGEKIRKIAGYDLFELEMKELNNSNGKCFFLGSSLKVLDLIIKRAAVDYPNVKVDFNSPPYSPEFALEENELMIQKINSFSPSVLFIGMTAPKQEKWAFANLNKLNVGHVCCIGAVFDYYAGTKKRAPKWMIDNGFEWMYRLITEPRRTWRRYLVNNFRFILLIVKEKLKNKHNIIDLKN
jgi:N-acetylglucosaminyldiphosphoundecaprenol N-acetyl-beta-D-mannosaminyltransferase